MGAARRLGFPASLGLTLFISTTLSANVVMRGISLDRPLVLDENTDYELRSVAITGLSDCAALTLTGRISSVLLDRCTFGRVWAGEEGTAAAMECAGAVVGTLTARHTTFFDAENQLAALREGSFGRVTFERCRFATSDSFLKQIYANNPWRTTPPVAEFYNIDRLELLDNEYSNTIIIIHPSVKQVVVRGTLPGLKLENPQATQVIRINPGQLASTVPSPAASTSPSPSPSACSSRPTPIVLAALVK
jgi:hypothetical protein